MIIPGFKICVKKFSKTRKEIWQFQKSICISNERDGNPCSYVDEGIKRRLETKLLSAILKFDAA